MREESLLLIQQTVTKISSSTFFTTLCSDTG